MSGAANNLGSFLKEKRKLKNYSLRDVQKLKDISNAYLSQIETGKIKKPSANILYKLSQLYDIQFNLLLKISGVINSTSDENLDAQTPSGYALLSENLTQEEEKQLTDYLKFIRQQKNEKG